MNYSISRAFLAVSECVLLMPGSSRTESGQFISNAANAAMMKAGRICPKPYRRQSAGGHARSAIIPLPIRKVRPMGDTARDAIPLTIYDQEGALVTMMVKDTPENRLLTEWIRVHDRYTPSPDNQGEG